MSQLLNLSRQRNQTLLFVTQEARQLDKNIASSASVYLIKDLGMLQLEFDRPELKRVIALAKEALDRQPGDNRPWTYVYSPDADFKGLLTNPLPSFWKPGLSKFFRGGAGSRCEPGRRQGDASGNGPAGYGAAPSRILLQPNSQTAGSLQVYCFELPSKLSLWS